MSISICEKTTTLIILELQIVHHFIEGTDILVDTTDINTTTILVLLVLVLSNSPVLLPLRFKVKVTLPKSIFHTWWLGRIVRIVIWYQSFTDTMHLRNKFLPRRKRAFSLLGRRKIAVDHGNHTQHTNTLLGAQI
jgi:hypothetical protein